MQGRADVDAVMEELTMSQVSGWLAYWTLQAEQVSGRDSDEPREQTPEEMVENMRLLMGSARPRGRGHG